MKDIIVGILMVALGVGVIIFLLWVTWWAITTVVLWLCSQLGWQIGFWELVAIWVLTSGVFAGISKGIVSYRRDR